MTRHCCLKKTVAAGWGAWSCLSNFGRNHLKYRYHGSHKPVDMPININMELISKSLCLMLLIGLGDPPAQPAPRVDIAVTSVFPEMNGLDVAGGATIRISLSSAVDPASLTDKTLLVFGLWSGVASGDIEISEDGRVISFFPQHPFSAGERVTVSIAKSLSGSDGTTLLRGYAWQFWVATRRADILLVETARIPVKRPGDVWIQTYGAYAGDLNGDGSTDFVVPNERTNDVRVFLNDGQGGYGPFKVYPATLGDRPSTIEGADFNRDGHIDFAVGNSTGRNVSVFLGDGTGALTQPRAYRVDSGVRGLAVLDLNGDGYPDIVTANRDAGSVTTLINDGTGSFLPSKSISTPGSGETAASAADMNEDGLLDLVIGSFESNDVQVLLADEHGELSSHGQTGAGEGVWMIVTGDVNGDGHVDVVTANAIENTVSVLFGDGAGNLRFSRAYPAGAFPLAVDLGDLDGDGDLDMVSSNYGSNRDGEPGSWRVFENRGDGVFAPVATFTSSGAGSCAVLHDRDNDGTLDMTAIDELEDLLILFTNRPLTTSVKTLESPGGEQRNGPGAEPRVILFPNPFRTVVTINVDVLSPVDLAVEVFDAAGRQIRSLESRIDGQVQTRQQWDGLDQFGYPVPAGAYLIRVSAGGRSTSRLLIRSGK